MAPCLIDSAQYKHLDKQQQTEQNKKENVYYRFRIKTVEEIKIRWKNILTYKNFKRKIYAEWMP